MGGFLSLGRGKTKRKCVLICFGQGKSSSEILQGSVQVQGPHREMDLGDLQNVQNVRVLTLRVWDSQG